jgi:hypothetical protein
VKVALLLAASISIASASAAGCGGSRTGADPMGPVVTVAPDEFALRDVRKDAARQLGCQVPNVSVSIGAWAGSEGNVVAFGCGYQVTYYLRCVTNHQCSQSVAD